MNLFEINTTTNKLSIHPEAYALDVFKKIWDRNRDKGVAEKELAYVYFMVDYKSPFSSILNEGERCSEVKSAVGLKDWQRDEIIEQAMVFYDDIQETPSLSLLRSALCAVEQIKKYFNTLDLQARDKRDMLINDPAKVTTMLKQIGDVIASLKRTEDEVRKEQSIKDVGKGNKPLGMYEKHDRN